MAPHSPSASPPRDAFPSFANGDVDIVLTPVQKLRLHSDVLRGASDKLKELLTIEYAAVLTKKALSEGVNVRYRLELVDVSTTPGDNVGRLVKIRLDHNGRPAPNPGTPRASMALSSHGADPASRAILSAWLSAFGALYGREMHLNTQNRSAVNMADEDYSDDNDDEETLHHHHHQKRKATTAGTMTDLCDIIATTSTVLDVVDYLQLPPSMVAPLELALLGTEQTLWQSVCAAPLAWVELGARLRSFAIWREAAVHVVGGWGDGESGGGSCEWSVAEKCALRREVRELCERKAARFEKWKEELEERLVGYMHEKLRWDVGRERGKGKKDHEPDVFYWQAQVLWGQWLAARFKEGEGKRAKDGGMALYRMIWEGRFCDAVEEQAKLAPLTPGGRKVVSEIVDEMKKDLKKMVEGATISKLKLDQSKMPANRMTPFVIEMRNAPWNKKEIDHRGSAHSNKRRRLESEMRQVPDEEDDLEDHIAQS
ncbi:hypothetical protein UCDDS831_g05220 [Diplodia seriata]|uniref:Uncharacterized protein n=1 Tax=Diplodia seriata TaxID=420778 RepID=A0A0G2EB79_9PEZI|nr:hypothetical protein UCDDS831_g05220 [Diplodia seriata]